MHTLAQVQARNGLMHAIWRAAVDEAYSAKDAARRMAALQGLSQAGVIAADFAEHPEMKEWADAHVAAGTCEDALRDLNATVKRARHLRAEQREARAKGAATTGTCTPAAELAGDRMAPFMLGPARIDAAPSPAHAPSSTSTDPDIYYTGAQGRPSSIKLVKAEMQRRAAAGEMITELFSKEKLL